MQPPGVADDEGLRWQTKSRPRRLAVRQICKTFDPETIMRGEHAPRATFLEIVTQGTGHGDNGSGTASTPALHQTAQARFRDLMRFIAHQTARFEQAQEAYRGEIAAVINVGTAKKQCQCQKHPISQPPHLKRTCT